MPVQSDRRWTKRFLASADLDRDGIADLVGFDCRGGFSAIGQGDGTFSPSFSFLTEFGCPSSVMVADLNNDHIDDVAVTRDSDQVSIFLGRGDGFVGEDVRYIVGQSPTSISSDDVNNDGLPDLAVVNAYSGTISILLGLGTGLFGYQTEYSVGEYPDSLAFGDLNRDGNKDLIVGFTSEIPPAVMTGVGDGTFNLPVVLPPGPEPMKVSLAHASDVNQDGIEDVAGLAPGRLVVWIGRGDGSFDEARAADPANVTPWANLVDINHDGRVDLVRQSGEMVQVLFGESDGSIGLRPRFLTSGSRPVVADLNLDGQADLVVTRGDRVGVLMGTGGGGLAPPVEYEGACSFVADFNRDGHQDLIGSDFLGRSYFLPGFGDGTFGTPIVSAVDFIGAIGDINRDGTPDILGGRPTIWARLGNGDGTFGPRMDIFHYGSSLDVALADLDGDGSLDLVAADRDFGELQLYFGAIDGTFPEHTILSGGTNAHGVEIGDFDADAIPDVVVGSRFTFRFYHGLGGGAFLGWTTLRFPSSSRFMRAGDLDNDRIDDLVLTQRGQVFLSFGSPDGPRRDLFGIGNLDGFEFSEIADLDGDGRTDLLFTNETEGAVYIFMNQGPFPNRAPTAVVAGQATSECTSPRGAMVILDGSTSADPDSSPGSNDDIVSFSWFEDSGVGDPSIIATGPSPAVELPLGVHRLTLEVVDRMGARSIATTSVTVSDHTPPLISVIAAPSVLWPPNHRMVNIESLVTATDACGTTSLALVSLNSSEPDNAPDESDGNTLGDIQGATIGSDDFEFQLRAERSERGTGRVYTIVYSATDSSGNRSVTGATVSVPLQVSRRTGPLQGRLVRPDDGVGAHRSGLRPVTSQ